MAEVFVIGGCNWDIKAKTSAAHKAATSNPSVISSKPGGVGRNIAHNLARLGVKVALQSVVGDDASGAAILAATACAGVDVASVAQLTGTSGTYLAILNHDGELVTAASDMGLLDGFTADMLDWPRIKAARFVVADCNLGLDVLHALSLRVGEKLIVEPVSVSKAVQILDALHSGAIFLATPNRDQFKVLSGALGLRNLVVHRGAEGALVVAGGVETIVPSQAVEIVDVTGAGDAATAGLVFGLTQNMSLVDAAAIGQAMAARVIASEFSTLE